MIIRAVVVGDLHFYYCEVVNWKRGVGVILKQTRQESRNARLPTDEWIDRSIDGRSCVHNKYTAVQLSALVISYSSALLYYYYTWTEIGPMKLIGTNDCDCWSGIVSGIVMSSFASKYIRNCSKGEEIIFRLTMMDNKEGKAH